MLEITGGRFWKPYKDMQSNAATKQSASDPMASLFQYRPPTDLTNSRLRKLAAALGPSYVRVSGTWANSTYFYDSDGPAPTTPPDGFTAVLSRKEWKGVVDFATAVNAEIITSFATSPGTRSPEGVWQPDQARSFIAYTKSLGGTIAPRPNYWAALLWNKLMGTTVLKSASAPAQGLRVYAQCMKGTPGGVTFLVINTNRKNAKTLTVSAASERYTMTAPQLEDTRVDLNGKELKLGANDSLPELRGAGAPSGPVTLPRASITFLAIREAHNASCH